MRFVLYVERNIKKKIMEQKCNKCGGPLEKVRYHYSSRTKCLKCQHEATAIRVALKKYALKERVSTES